MIDTSLSPHWGNGQQKKTPVESYFANHLLLMMSSAYIVTVIRFTCKAPLVSFMYPLIKFLKIVKPLCIIADQRQKSQVIFQTIT